MKIPQILTLILFYVEPLLFKNRHITNKEAL